MYRHIYSSTCFATNKRTGDRIAENIPFQFDSKDDRLAEAYALEEICKTVFPRDKYYQHSVLIERIEDQWIIEAYKEIMKGR